MRGTFGKRLKLKGLKKWNIRYCPVGNWGSQVFACSCEILAYENIGNGVRPLRPAHLRRAGGPDQDNQRKNVPHHQPERPIPEVHMPLGIHPEEVREAEDKLVPENTIV